MTGDERRPPEGGLYAIANDLAVMSDSPPCGLYAIANDLAIAAKREERRSGSCGWAPRRTPQRS
jgi:hypothetical protein